MQEGLAMIITGVEEDVDPLLDPVLEKQFVRRGKRAFVTVSDKQMVRQV
jgi:dynein heavy chain